MYNKRIVITTAIIAVALLFGIFATTPITTVYAEESETENSQKCDSNEVLTSGNSIASVAVECAVL